MEAGAAAAVADVIVAKATPDAAFDLVSRSPTLAGAVPVRAARSCPPFLSANALGWYLRPKLPLVVRRGLRKVEASSPACSARALTGGSVEVVVATGISLSASEGVRCVVETPMNRRDRRVEVERVELAAGRGIELRLIVALRRGETVSLEGELACVTPLVEPGAIRIADAASAPELVRATARFFDADYFDSKRRGPTQRYKRLARSSPAPTELRGAGVTVLHLGGAPPRVVREPDGGLALTIACELDVALSFHGHTVEAALDPEALRRRARTIREGLRVGLGGEPPDGVARYFTTYLTAHAPGDPHAFFKPATLVATEPGWSLVVDGPSGPGLQGMRGVTDPSWFHALPAVTEVVGDRGTLSRGSRLVTVRFTRTELTDATLDWAR